MTFVGQREIERLNGRGSPIALDGRRHAVFSEDGEHRFLLAHEFVDHPNRTVLFLCMNPSFATDQLDDTTVAKLARIAEHNAFESFQICNCVPYRASVPGEVPPNAFRDEILEMNDETIQQSAANAHTIVIAHGNPPFPTRDWRTAFARAVDRLPPGIDKFAFRWNAPQAFNQRYACHPSPRRGAIPEDRNAWVPVLQDYLQNFRPN